MTDRRGFLAGLLATGVAPRAGWAEAGQPVVLAAGMRPDGVYVLCGLGRDGGLRFTVPLPARGHAAAAHPERAEAVAFARRPGRFALILDCVSGAERARLQAPAGRHFYGHGAFSGDGRILVTTENDYEGARGVLGFWDVTRGYRRMGEVGSGGVGPHEIRLMPDGQSLVVANGGIETHPETGRAKLNLGEMRPNLSYVDLDGVMLEQVALAPDLHQNSIRHLAVARDGTVAFAMQWQGDIYDSPPLVGMHQRGGAVRLIGTEADGADMQGYGGSVAVLADGAQVAVTSPKGGVARVYGASGRLEARVALADVCGVAALRHGSEGFWLTTGDGLVTDIGASWQMRHPMRWDNHLVAL